MSYLFSRVLVEDYLQAKCLDGEPFAQLNVMPTAHKFWHKDKTMDHLSLSQFGLTLKVLTEDHGAELLRSYLAGFLVRTLAPRETELDSVESDQDCGGQWHESLAKYNRDSRLWKTAPCSPAEDSGSSLVIWPKWGSMRNGVCYQRPMLVRHTKEKESGLLPTPMASDWKGGTVSIRRDTGKQRLDQFRDWIKCMHGLTYPIPEHSEAMMGWPNNWTSLKEMNYADSKFWKESCCQSVQVNFMRGLWRAENIAASPQRQKPVKQSTGKYFYSLSEVSQRGSYVRWNMGKGKNKGNNLQSLRKCVFAKENKKVGDMFSGLPVSLGFDQCKQKMETKPSRNAALIRTERLKAIGNGQVPICAATAFRLLRERI